MNNFKKIEYKIFNSNRFSLKKTEELEISKDLKFSNILILGAAGSIGSEFTKKILSFNFKSLTLVDKDENCLTELNRDINLFFPKKKTKINYQVLDITSCKIDTILKSKKITHYFNFAALKHVRTEESFNSIKYMLKTNSFDFLPTKKYFLKKFFSISTDKACEPKSILGISKKIMEINLAKFKRKYSKIHVSSTRFANVAFSRGSILEFANNRIDKKLSFGVPKNIKRFFINHNEACNLCFKSMLTQSDGAITIPNPKKFSKEYFIFDIIKKILKIKKIKYVLKKKITADKRNILQIELKDQKNHGQKLSEKFKEDKEKFFQIKNDNTILVLPFSSSKISINSKITNIKNFNSLKSFLKKKFKSFKIEKNLEKISNEL